jgi:fermentation-respiration switch protein FrsA (DUF1100 family)
LDSLQRINQVKVPMVIAHGTNDDVVPFHMGEKLFAAATARKRFVRAEGGSHHNLTASFYDDYSRAVKEHFGLMPSFAASGGAGAQTSSR